MNGHPELNAASSFCPPFDRLSSSMCRTRLITDLYFSVKKNI